MAYSRAGSSPAIGNFFIYLMKSKIIKKKFLKFFKDNGYKEKQECPLVPFKDDSILFTNSGMVQFKNIFLGLESCKYDKVTTSQTCIRLGGKHNDLENIGNTPHHNTSFTMLGNFCFKNASKQEAIILAWSFLTNILSLDKNKLHVTVHENDSESFDIWSNSIKLDLSHITKSSDETNFWSMDEVGPCGYCTEIFYNIGNNNLDLLEIWNLVFIQFEKKNNKLINLKDLFIDTGMGLERISSIKQKVFDNFKTDLLKPLLDVVKNFFNSSEINQNIKIITDHIKTCVLLISQGLYPSNVGRGYILKKLIRRSIIKKKELNVNFSLSDLIDSFVVFFDGKISEKNISIIKNIIRFEEDKFERTLKNGINFLRESLNNKKEIDGKTIFKLYDTYGIPLYVLNNMLNKEIESLDLVEFNSEMENHSRINRKKNNDSVKNVVQNFNKTIFSGYNESVSSSEITKIIKDDNFLNSAEENNEVVFVLSKTCFYPEKGGQVGDSGFIKKGENLFKVIDTKDFNGAFFHYGKVLKGSFCVGDKVSAEIDLNRRILISINHSATHLLHTVLRNVLGDHVKQAGSLINEEYLRFDFTHFKSLSYKEISEIEFIINNYIKLNLKTKVKLLDFDSDLEKNRIVYFEKNVSKEFCAGTHVKNSRDIGFFKIIKEFGIGANTRRIEAVTNEKVISISNKNTEILEELSKKLNTNKEDLLKSVDNILIKNKFLQKNNENLIIENIKNSLINSKDFKFFSGVKFIVFEIRKENANILKNIISNFYKTVIISYTFDKDSIFLNINISNDINFLNAYEIIMHLGDKFGVKGGGKSNFSSGVVLNKNFNDILDSIYLYVESLGNKN